MQGCGDVVSRKDPPIVRDDEFSWMGYFNNGSKAPHVEPLKDFFNVEEKTTDEGDVLIIKTPNSKDIERLHPGGVCLVTVDGLDLSDDAAEKNEPYCTLRSATWESKTLHTAKQCSATWTLPFKRRSVTPDVSSGVTFANPTTKSVEVSLKCYDMGEKVILFKKNFEKVPGGGKPVGMTTMLKDEESLKYPIAVEEETTKEGDVLVIKTPDNEDYVRRHPGGVCVATVDGLDMSDDAAEEKGPYVMAFYRKPGIYMANDIKALGKFGLMATSGGSTFKLALKRPEDYSSTNSYNRSTKSYNPATVAEVSLQCYNIGEKAILFEKEVATSLAEVKSPELDDAVEAHRPTATFVELQQGRGLPQRHVLHTDEGGFSSQAGAFQRHEQPNHVEASRISIPEK